MKHCMSCFFCNIFFWGGPVPFLSLGEEGGVQCVCENGQYD